MRAPAIGILVALILCATSARAEVWVENSTTKVLKDFTSPGKGATVSLEAARNEYEGFQVVVKAGEAPIKDVVAVMGDLHGPSGKTIPAANATLYLEYYVEIENPSPCDEFFVPDCGGLDEYIRTPGLYPDALVPIHDPYESVSNPGTLKFTVAPGDLQTIFVDLYVPKGASPGGYYGELKLYAEGKHFHTVPVTVEVWHFEIPSKRNVATAFGFSFGHLPKYHGGPEGPDAETLAKISRNYELEVHRHRIDFTTYKGPVSFEFEEDGSPKPVDFSTYDEYMSGRLDGSYFPDGAGVNRFNVGIFRPGHGTMGLTDDQFAVAAKTMAEHLDEKGWLDNAYLYSLDEPWILDHWRAGSYEKIQHDVLLLNQETDLWKGHVLVTGPWQSQLDQEVDIWCPVTAMYGDVFWPEKSWPPASKYQEMIAEGKELWFYVCNANFPPLMGYDIDTKIGYEPRLTKWGAWAENATGFLFWSMTYWYTSNPWHDLANVNQFGAGGARNGDGILLYPGDHNGTAGGSGSPEWVSLDGPVISFRMKQIRDGLEDWEMFLRAKELGVGEYTRAQVSTAYTAFGQVVDENFDIKNPPWTLDEEVLLTARRNIAHKIQHTLYPDLYPDPEAANAADESAPETAPDYAPDVTSSPSEIITAGETHDPDVITTTDPAFDTPTTRSSGCNHGQPSAACWPWLLLLLAMLGRTSCKHREA